MTAPATLHEEIRRIRAQAAARGGHALSVRSIVRLQQTLGNREVARLLTERGKTEIQPAPGTAVVPVEAATLSVRWESRLSRVWGWISLHRLPAAAAAATETPKVRDEREHT